jgi:hypothetical protein
MSQEFVLQDTREKLKGSLELQSLWRRCELLSAFFGVLGIVFATFDYERRYADGRLHDNCVERPGISEQFRWLDFWCTAAALVLLLLRHKLKLEWIQYQSEKQDVIWVMKGAFNKNVGLSPRKFLTPRLVLEVAILLVFPYPNVSGCFGMMLRRPIVNFPNHFTVTSVQYFNAELLYVLMFLRLYFVIRAFFNYGEYMDNHARMICSQYGVKANMRFSTRALVKSSPIFMVILFVIPTSFVFAIFIRVFERPYVDISLQDFNTYYNSVWLSIMTMTTIAYGDITPHTHLGRTCTLMVGIWGLFGFSTVVFILNQSFQLSRNQTKAFEAILKTRKAASAIIAFMLYTRYMNRYGRYHDETISHRHQLMDRLTEFHKERLDLTNTYDLETRDRLDVHHKLNALEQKAQAIQGKLGKFDQLERQVADITETLTAMMKNASSSRKTCNEYTQCSTD